MRTDVIVDILYSTYIQDYYVFFILLVSGYFVLVYFLAYILGHIPFIKNIFFKNTFLSVVILLPIFYGILKILFNIEYATYFMEERLFVILFLSISLLVFVYAGLKQINSDLTFINIVYLYRVPIVFILITTIFYAKNYFDKNYSFINSKIKNDIYHELHYIKVNNERVYDLAQIMTNVYINSTNSEIKKLNYEKNEIINSFNEQINEYDKKFEELNNRIDNSREVIDMLEGKYKNKIDLVDIDMDNNKLRLDSIYKEWKSNVENNIVNLDTLVNESKLKLKMLDNNEKLITNFRKDLLDNNKNISSLKSNYDVLNNQIVNVDKGTKSNKEKLVTLEKNIELNKNRFIKLESKVESIGIQVDETKKEIEEEKKVKPIASNKSKNENEVKEGIK
jgi:hypothetical protein